MVLAKNYETMSTFVKVMQKKLWPLFSDTVYSDFTHYCTLVKYVLNRKLGEFCLPQNWRAHKWTRLP